MTHEIDEDYSFATLKIAETYKILGEYEKSLEFLLRDYEDNSEDIWLNFEIGWLYDELGNFEEAYRDI